MVGLYRVVICQYNDYNGKPDIYIINCFVSVIWQNLPSICSDGIPTVFLHYLSNAYRCPESRLPYFPEVVLIDIALVLVGADTATSADGTVNQDGTY